MDKDLLKKTFREYKKAAGLAYAITNPDNLGYEMGDVNYTLCEKYGEDSKGIWAKNWQRGYNARPALERATSVTIAHDITPEQADIFYKVFGEHYNITPSAYDPHICFTLYEKDKAVFMVSRTMSREWSLWDREESRSEIVVGRDRLYKMMMSEAESLKDDASGIKAFSVERIF